MEGRGGEIGRSVSVLARVLKKARAHASDGLSSHSTRRS